MPVLAAVACATGGGGGAAGSPGPHAIPRLAAGSTPEPARYEIVVPGGRAAVRARIAHVLADSAFDVSPSEQGAVTGYSLARLLKVRLETAPVGRDSTRVAVTGELYVGDTARRDSISGLPERWRLITPADGGSIVLRDLARSFRALRVDGRGPARGADGRRAPGAGTGTSTGSAPPRDGSSGVGGERAMRAPTPGTPADPAIAALLAATSVGRSVEVCRSPWVPNGWLVLFWRVDPSRCQGLPDTHFAGEPNVMRIEREW